MNKTVQTWLPYKSYVHSAEALANLQINDAASVTYRLLETIHETYESPRIPAWQPIYKMWLGFEPQLAEYGICLAEEAAKRGEALKRESGLVDRFRWHLELSVSGDADIKPPPWLGDPGLHYSHQSNLIKKDPGHYRPLFGDAVPDDLPIVWPVT